MERKLENVSLEITKKCIFHCDHCCNESGQSSAKQLSKDEILILLKQLKDMKIRRIGFTGGEPFCDENLFEYIDYIKKDIPEITIATNGYLVDSSIVEKLKNMNVTNVAVSLDGTKVFHDKFRGMTGAYDRAIKAIKMLANANIKVKVRSVVTIQNRDEILKLIEIMNNLKIKRHEILPVCPIGRANDDMILTSEEYEGFVKSVIEKISNLDKVNITFKIKPVYGQEYLFENVDKRFKEKSLSYRCDALKDSIEITFDGDVIPCSFVREPIGNIRTQNIRDIFYGDVASEYYDKIHNSYRTGPCKECEYTDQCNGGCYAHRLYGNGVDKKDIYCFAKGKRYV